MHCCLFIVCSSHPSVKNARGRFSLLESVIGSICASPVPLCFDLVRARLSGVCTDAGVDCGKVLLCHKHAHLRSVIRSAFACAFNGLPSATSFAQFSLERRPCIVDVSSDRVPTSTHPLGPPLQLQLCFFGCPRELPFRHFTSLTEWADVCNMSNYSLFAGDATISSARGVQQAMLLARRSLLLPPRADFEPTEPRRPHFRGALICKLSSRTTE